MLRLFGIEKRFGSTVALRGVTLELGRGEVHALIGENGAGKTTLMNVLAGAVRPDAGAMELEGQPYLPQTPREARQRGIALIHQELSLCPHLTVAENILLGNEPQRFGWLDREAARRKAFEVLRDFGHPEIDPARRVADLSLAARQVVEICRAIAARARIILMDEPTSSLQRDDVERLFALIRHLRARDQVSFIYISHFLEEVRAIATRYTVLRDGASVASGEISTVTDEYLIAKMVGRAIEDLYPRRKRAPGAPLLTVHELCAPPLLKRASFEVRAGEIFGIAGLIGSGRTRLVRTLFGLEPACSGTLIFQTQRLVVRGATPALRLRQSFGYLSEDRKGEGLALPLSIADNITLTRFESCARLGWLDRTRQQAQARSWMDKLGIRARSPAQAVGTLSGGNQQKVALARLLHQGARVLLLDEPTRGIDIGSKLKVYETIAECAARGCAILLISSYLPELFGMCDRLAVMCRGVLSEARPIEEWTPEEVMRIAISGKRNEDAGAKGVDDADMVA